MGQTPLNEVRLQNFLSDYTDAVLKDSSDPALLLQKYGIGAEDAPEINELMKIVARIRAAMPHVSPSDAFVAALYSQLTGEETLTLLNRMRQLPRHVRWAAGLTLTAGMVWFVARARREYFAGQTQRYADSPNTQESLASTATA